MSCCEGTGGLERFPGTGCCGTSCTAGKTGCLASEPRIRSCFCQENLGCLERPNCGGFRPRGTAATGACPGPCQCAEEEVWNLNVPPKPNCEWLSNFSELRRQWSDHGRQNNCKCCNCKPCRTAPPCRPCLTPPTCSTTNFPRDDYKTCCNERLSGGACCQEAPQNCCSSSQQQDYISSGGCTPSNFGCSIPLSCPPSPISNMYSCSPPPCSSPSACSIRNSWAACRPPSSCQPCSPSPRAILKKRSCCQCITGYCMCQPMPRTCNCPPPVQVDARAERECSCDCPSSPECACPPSERRFSRTKVKCPNARLCCPTPRPQPGPKCSCTKCQPCLPPPCDPCTSSKCRTVVPKVKPCCGDSLCEENAPCRPGTPQPSSPCRPTPPCTACRKTSPPCPSPAQPCSPCVSSASRPNSGRLIRLLNRPRSPDTVRRSATPSSKCCSPGQSRNRVDLHHNNNDERDKLTAADEGFGDYNGEAGPGYRGAQCHCGPSGSRGCDEECDFCCSLDCDNIFLNEKLISDDIIDATDNYQCKCGNASGCAEECDYCCSVECDKANDTQGDNGKHDDDRNPAQCCCGIDGKTCAESCDYCCSLNCDSQSLDSKDRVEESKPYANSERIAAGATSFSDDAKDITKRYIDGRICGIESRASLYSTDTNRFTENSVSSDSLTKCGSRWFNSPLESTPEVPHLEALSRCSSSSKSNVQNNDESRSKALKKDKSGIVSCSEVTGVSSGNPVTACKLLRSLILIKSAKYLQR